MKRQRAVKQHTMTLNGSSERIFPLLCPVREYAWIEPWQCEMVYSDSGFAELDAVFKTSFPNDGPEDTWVISVYQPPGRIEFVRINPLRSIRFAIFLADQENGSTLARWTQVITALTPEGDQFVADFTDEAYHEEMTLLEKMINHYCQTGRMLKMEDESSRNG